MTFNIYTKTVLEIAADFIKELVKKNIEYW